ncbi:hypothetical protein KC852_02225 [Candidatus Nomurabacteria bacterium]|nr:hypothetical protein [Candidatus Nomurabacteria bacterium]
MGSSSYQKMTSEDHEVIPTIARKINSKYYAWKAEYGDSMDHVSLDRGLLMISGDTIKKGQTIVASNLPEMEDETEALFANSEAKWMARSFKERFQKMIDGKTKAKNVIFLFLVYLYWVKEMPRVSPSEFLSAVSKELKNKEKRYKRKVSEPSPDPLQDYIESCVRDLNALHADKDHVHHFIVKALELDNKDAIEDLFIRYRDALYRAAS